MSLALKGIAEFSKSSGFLKINAIEDFGKAWWYSTQEKALRLEWAGYKKWRAKLSGLGVPERN